MKGLFFFLRAYIEKTRYYSAGRSQRQIFVGLNIDDAKRLSIFLGLVSIAWLIKKARMIIVSRQGSGKREEYSYLFLDDIELGCSRGIGLVTSATGIYQQSISYYRCDYTERTRTDIPGRLFGDYSALIKKVVHGQIQVVILFEGDKPEQVLIGALQRVWGRETVCIQWGAYIYAELTLAQKSLPFTRLYIKNMYYRNRLERLGIRLCRNTEVLIGSYESLLIDKECEGNSSVYFIGQPFGLSECLDKRYSGGNEVTYRNYIQKAQMIATSSGKTLRYIPHPKEIARIKELKSEGLEISEIGIENTTFTQGDVAIGCYSSLLVDLTLGGVDVVLICESYEGTIFEDLAERGNVMLVSGVSSAVLP